MLQHNRPCFRTIVMLKHNLRRTLQSAGATVQLSPQLLNKPAQLVHKNVASVTHFIGLSAMTTEFIVSLRMTSMGLMNPAPCRFSANSSNVNVPPVSVFTSMLMANIAPSLGRVRHWSITMSRMAIFPSGSKALNTLTNSSRLWLRECWWAIALTQAKSQPAGRSSV